MYGDGPSTEKARVTTYSNDFEAGNIIFRGDVGAYRNVSNSLAIDISVSGRASNLLVNQFQVEYITDGGRGEKNIFIESKGVSLGIYFGIKYKIHSL